jgi:hypothetical protein
VVDSKLTHYEIVDEAARIARIAINAKRKGMTCRSSR